MSVRIVFSMVTPFVMIMPIFENMKLKTLLRKVAKYNIDDWNGMSQAEATAKRVTQKIGELSNDTRQKKLSDMMKACEN